MKGFGGDERVRDQKYSQTPCTQRGGGPSGGQRGRRWGVRADYDINKARARAAAAAEPKGPMDELKNVV